MKKWDKKKDNAILRQVARMFRRWYRWCWEWIRGETAWNGWFWVIFHEIGCCWARFEGFSDGGVCCWQVSVIFPVENAWNEWFWWFLSENSWVFDFWWIFVNLADSEHILRAGTILVDARDSIDACDLKTTRNNTLFHLQWPLGGLPVMSWQ